MTDRTLVVLMEGRRMGVVTQEATGRMRFEYDEQWRLAPQSTPLSMSMPMETPSHPHDVIDAFLWGLLPDNENVLRRWGRENQVSHRNPFALLTHVGEECAGAAQFVRPERVEEAAHGGDVDWLTADDVAEIIRTLRRDPTAWLTKLRHGRFSLAGAQAKVALLHDGGRWGRPSGRIPTTHILKPAIAGLDDHDLNEHLCLRAARLAGLRTALTEVVRFGDERAIVVTRYDRVHLDGRLIRVHQEDLCQAFGTLPTQKYQYEGGPSALSIADFLRTANSEAGVDVFAFFEALAFNWLIAGTDAHAKNYSLLLSGRQVRLAPLYDVASVLPYEEIDLREEKMAMSIGKEYRLEWIAARHWVRLAEAFQLDVDVAMSRLREMAETVPGCFARAAREDAVRSLDSPLPARLTAAVEERASSCKGLLERGL